MRPSCTGKLRQPLASVSIEALASPAHVTFTGLKFPHLCVALHVICLHSLAADTGHLPTEHAGVCVCVLRRCMTAGKCLAAAVAARLRGAGGCSRYRSGAALQGLGSICTVTGLGFRVQGLAYWVHRLEALGFGAQGL